MPRFASWRYGKHPHPGPLPEETGSDFAGLAFDLDERVNRDFERPNFAAEATASDPEHARGLGLIAVANAQHAGNDIALHELERLGVQVGRVGLEPFIDEVPQIGAVLVVAAGGAGGLGETNAIGDEVRDDHIAGRAK